jgi:hypothetical protein
LREDMPAVERHDGLARASLHVRAQRQRKFRN